MQAYWSQYNTEEIREMQGIEDEREEAIFDSFEEDEETECYCTRCSDSGCNWCLMLDY